MNFRKLTVVLIAFATLIITSCNKEETTPTNNTNVGGPAPNTPDQQKLLDLVNAARATGHKCGNTFYPAVPALTWNATLATAAQKHSDYMNSTGNFSHTGENGSSAGDRISAEGYNWMAYGENIAEGYATEEAVVQAWLESEGHCKNIMSADYKEMGVATSGNYWTQVFGTQQ